MAFLVLNTRFRARIRAMLQTKEISLQMQASGLEFIKKCLYKAGLRPRQGELMTSMRYHVLSKSGGRVISWSSTLVARFPLRSKGASDPAGPASSSVSPSISKTTPGSCYRCASGVIR